MRIRVASISDGRLDEYRNVPDPELLRARGIFVAEGRLVVQRLLAGSRFRTRSVLLTPAACDAMAAVIDRVTDVPVYVVAQDVMNEISGFNMHRGCLAIGERAPTPDWTGLVRNASLVVVLERMSNADNVGGIFRNAAAFGADAVLLGPACADPLYRKAIRTSMGAALRLPFAPMPDWPRDLVRLRASGFRLLALTPGHAPVLHDVLDAGQPFTTAGIALLLGHEGEGLSSDALAVADLCARIPMAPDVDSLNAATAAAIALYELSRLATRR